jgi:hypothetical protein
LYQCGTSDTRDSDFEENAVFLQQEDRVKRPVDMILSCKTR